MSVGLLRNSAEGGTNGVTPTGASGGNTGGASGDFLDQVVKVGAPAITFDTTQHAHGSLSYHYVVTTTTDLVYVVWSGNSTISANQMSVRGYIRWSALPSAGFDIITIRSATAPIAKFACLASNKFFTQDNVGGVTFPTVFTINNWYRIEMECIIGVDTSHGTVHSAYYLADSLTPVDPAWAPGATRNTGIAPITQARFGKMTAVGTMNAWFDDLAIDDTTSSPLGPSIFGATVTPSVIPADATLMTSMSTGGNINANAIQGTSIVKQLAGAQSSTVEAAVLS